MRLVFLTAAILFAFPPSIPRPAEADPSGDGVEEGLRTLDQGDRIKVEDRDGTVREGTYRGFGEAGLRVESDDGTHEIGPESVEIVWERNRRFWAGAY